MITYVNKESQKQIGSSNPDKICLELEGNENIETTISELEKIMYSDEEYIKIERKLLPSSSELIKKYDLNINNVSYFLYCSSLPLASSYLQNQKLKKFPKTVSRIRIYSECNEGKLILYSTFKKINKNYEELNNSKTLNKISKLYKKTSKIFNKSFETFKLNQLLF